MNDHYLFLRPTSTGSDFYFYSVFGFDSFPSRKLSYRTMNALMMVIMFVIFKFCPRIQPTDAIILPMRARCLPNPLCCGLLFLPRNAVSPPKCCRITNTKNMHPPLTWACFNQSHSAKVDKVGRIL